MAELSEADMNEETNQIADRTPFDVEESEGGGSRLLPSLTRLVVGGALVGWDELVKRIEMWDEETRSTIDSQTEPREVIIIDDETESTERMAAPEPSARLVRFALVGMLFETQSRFIERTATAVRNADRSSKRALTPVSRWTSRSRLAKAAQERFDGLVTRGETVTRRWIERGRIEDDYSRRLVRTAAQDSFSDSMEQLGQAPALQSLVRKQSAGLTQDALDEVRVRTVSGDLVLEGFMRSILRRKPRRTLPAPPTAKSSYRPGEGE